jgi:5-formyltetrahydrofolate cyclo-ligase
MVTSRADMKANLRRRLRAQREERYVEHNLLHLLELPEFSQSKIIASYYSYGTEPDTHQLNKAIIESGRTLLLPRINGETLDWIQWDGSADSLAEEGKFHQPIGEVFIDLAAIDLVLVPALAIDPDGYRLGQGGGFYDRSLPLLKAWKHGVVYTYEKMEHDLPREKWDIPMDSW